MSAADGAHPIYLDHNATTPIAPVVRDAMLPWLGEQFGNPSSSHVYGRLAAAAVAEARERVAALIGASADEITFTGGGTEADNLALLGVSPKHRRLVISAVEHPAVEQPAAALDGDGWTVDRLPVEPDGRVDLDAAAELLATPCGLVSVILAQNESGVIQPVAELSALAKRATPSVIVHTDAAQAVGKIPVDVSDLGVDLLTVVSHKLYGPKGIGALYVRDGVEVRPRLLGGGQERGLRPGTEPVAIIVGLGAACELARGSLADEATRQAGLRERLWARLQAEVEGIARTGAGAPCLPNTLHVRFPGVAGPQILANAHQIAASTGSACHADDAATKGVLGAMGVPVADAVGAVRLSLGRSTTDAQIELAADVLIRAWRQGLKR